MAQKPILVSGAHRSGSTWIGRMISLAPDVKYVYEPFNIQLKIHETPIEYWYEYISEKTPLPRQQEILKYLQSLDKPTLSEVLRMAFKESNPKRAVRLARNWSRDRKKRTLFKDPLALMSAPWMFEKTGCDVVIVIRHPAAFVASLKVKNWQFPFHHFVEQRELMRSVPDKFRNEINSAVKGSGNIIEQGSLLWNVLYSRVSDYRNEYGDRWLFIRHEDLSMDPESNFENIFDHLGLEYSAEIKDEIMRSTTSKQEGKWERNSRKNVFSWKERLTNDEIDSIKEKTSSIWPAFYSEGDWG